MEKSCSDLPTNPRATFATLEDLYHRTVSALGCLARPDGLKLCPIPHDHDEDDDDHRTCDADPIRGWCISICMRNQHQRIYHQGRSVWNTPCNIYQSLTEINGAIGFTTAMPRFKNFHMQISNETNNTTKSVVICEWNDRAPWVHLYHFPLATSALLPQYWRPITIRRTSHRQ